VAKVFPSDSTTRFLVCENIREEARGKISFLGVYTGDQILVPINTTVVTLASVAFWFGFLDGEGQFAATVSLFSPTKTLLDQASMPAAEKEIGKMLNLIVNLAPFRTDEFGTYRAVAYLDQQAYERKFEIRKDPSMVP
jgi:hypothetical protein